MRRFATIALNLPVDREVSYRIAPALAGQLQLGSRVRVPFRGRKLAGVVVALSDDCDLPSSVIKEVHEHMTGLPLLPESLLEFTRLLAKEYACSWGTALEAALPASLKRPKKNWITAVDPARSDTEILAEACELEEKAPKRSRVLRAVIELEPPVPLPLLLRRTGLSRSPVQTLVKYGWLRWTRLEQEEEPGLLQASALETAPRHDLSPAQRVAVERVLVPLRERRNENFLLHGVTGSGKTEVYLRILEEVRKQDRTAIILVPEISLTPQTIGRFRSRFPDVAVLHSSLTDAMRAQQWLRLAKGTAKIVVGARSALFAPLRNVGLIVVDEEHESSFKQQQNPRYHAREMAVLRGRIENACVVLGTATPSLESWERCRAGIYTKISLPHRVGSGRQPRILTVDMRQEKPFKGRVPVISKRLEILMRERLAAREQVLLFLNRRGFSSVLYCTACGENVSCKDCESAMTWHAAKGCLLCHFCMHERRRPELCPSCEAARLSPLGHGTEKVEGWVARAFPDAVVARMDSDSMVRRDSYEKVLGAFRKHDIDVLIGTQMIAKGLDFPNVTLVGVISADTGLFMPDFRASERCFQLLAQVSGRAGRGEKEGIVVIQTLCPEATPIQAAAKLDYEGFAAQESEARKKLGYPPFSRLLRLILESENLLLAKKRAKVLGERLRQQSGRSGFRVLGPAPAPLSKLRGRYRFHIVVKCPDVPSFEAARSLCRELSDETSRKLRVILDVDPAALL